MERITAAYATERTRQKLGRNSTGEVFMVNSAGVYLNFSGRILLLCDISWGLLPIGISIEAFDETIKQFGLRQGQPVTVRENRLVFLGGTIVLRFAEPPAIEVHFGQPQPERIRQAAWELAALQKTKGLSPLVMPLVLDIHTDATRRDPDLKQPILVEGQLIPNTKWLNTEQLNPYCMAAYPWLKRLMTALRKKEEQEIVHCIGRLLGLGMGLTPSADDVFMGMLFVFRQLPESDSCEIRLFRETIQEQCAGKTNQVSSAYLKAMAEGERFEAMERVWNGLCGKEKLEIEQLTRIGSNSGAEMLLGMLLAAKQAGCPEMNE